MTVNVGRTFSDEVCINLVQIAFFQAQATRESLQLWVSDTAPKKLAEAQLLPNASLADYLHEYLGLAKANAIALEKDALRLASFVGSSQAFGSHDSGEVALQVTLLMRCWIKELFMKSGNVPAYAERIVAAMQAKQKTIGMFTTNHFLCTRGGGCCAEANLPNYFAAFEPENLSLEVSVNSSIRLFFGRFPKKYVPPAALAFAFGGCGVALAVESKSWRGFKNALNISKPSHALGTATVVLGAVFVLYCLALCVYNKCRRPVAAPLAYH